MIKRKNNSRKHNAIIFGIAIGSGMISILGIALNNITIGFSIGIGVGILFGYVIYHELLKRENRI